VEEATEVGQPAEEALQRLRGRYVLDTNALMHVAGSDWVTPELVTRLSRDPRPPSAAGSDGKPGARGYAAPVACKVQRSDVRLSAATRPFKSRQAANLRPTERMHPLWVQ
jgi:hypothetical protein